MLKLYKAGNSICSQKVLMTLDEKGIDFDIDEINLFNNEQYDPEYLKLNPKGVVPTLDHDGSISGPLTDQISLIYSDLVADMAKRVIIRDNSISSSLTD